MAQQLRAETSEPVVVVVPTPRKWCHTFPGRLSPGYKLAKDWIQSGIPQSLLPKPARMPAERQPELGAQPQAVHLQRGPSRVDQALTRHSPPMAVEAAPGRQDRTARVRTVPKAVLLPTQEPEAVGQAETAHPPMAAWARHQAIQVVPVGPLKMGRPVVRGPSLHRIAIQVEGGVMDQEVAARGPALSAARLLLAVRVAKEEPAWSSIRPTVPAAAAAVRAAGAVDRATVVSGVPVVFMAVAAVARAGRRAAARLVRVGRARLGSFA